MKKFSKTLITSLVISLVLGGCAFDKLDNSLPYLKGQSVDTAMSYLGIPDNQLEIDKNKVYIWGYQNSGTYMMPVTNTTSYTGYSSGYGTYGSAFGNSYGTATTTSYVPQSFNHQCAIKALTNKKGIIQAIEYEGNLAGCGAFSSAMDKIKNDFSPNTLDVESNQTKKP